MLGLVLGGGGPIGIAWEIGVLAALEEQGVLRAADVGVIIGTSAGSVVGTQLRLGRSLEFLAEREKTTEDVASQGTQDIERDPSIVMEVFRLWSAPSPMTEERAARIGAKAVAAPTVDEAAWVEVFEELVGREWPTGDLRVVAVNCRTGARAVWTAASGVPLCRAVASSCAVPSLFPAVTIDGDRYTDGGVWSSGSADLLIGTGADTCLFLGPMIGPGGLGQASADAFEREAGMLAAEGIACHSVVPGERFRSAGLSLMDGARRHDAVEVGRAEGAEAAGALRAALSSA